MSGKELIDQIRHYQKDIERCPENSERMIRCIKRLYVLPVLVQHLQETGVGRSVNALRKYNGEVGEAAKALVAKWKAMVAAEESSEGEQVQEISIPEKEKVVQEQKPSKSSRDNREKSHSSSSSRHHSKENEEKKKVHSGSSSSSRSDHRHEKSDKHSEKRSSEKHSSNKHKYSKYDKNKEYVESDESSGSTSRRKRKKHSSSEKKSDDDHKSKRIKVEEHSLSESDEGRSEDESDMRNGRVESDKSDDEDEVEEGIEEEEEEEENEQEEAESEEQEEETERKDESEAESDSSSDHKHRSKHKHSHHRSSHHSSSSRSKSSHSSRDKHHHSERKKEDKHKEKHNSHSRQSSSKDIDTLIKENERKIKKEKGDVEDKEHSKKEDSSQEKKSKIKIEKNEDGSIDAGSGASFAQALMGGDAVSSPKKKKKSSYTVSSSKKSESSSSRSHRSKDSSSRSKESSSSSSKSKDSPSKHHSSSSKPSSSDLTKMPDLLAKPVKLETLPLDISSTLPEISPNYKPLPHFPQTIQSRRLSKTSEEEAMSSIMTTKYQRTKVFCGNKTGGFAVVPSLYSICIQLLYDNIDAVEFTGGVPYDILKPLLEKLSAYQLLIIEHHNPYLIEDTDSLWQFHSKKDFRGESKQELESWRELYSRCMDERERKLQALTKNIKQSIEKSTPVRTTKLAYVDTAKPPRNIARKQAKYGTGKPIKQEIISKAVVGGHTPGVTAKDVVPAPPGSHSSRSVSAPVMKKKKAPLMAKALQLIKGNRFKR